MNTKREILCPLVALLCLPVACFGDKLSKVANSAGPRDERLQSSFIQFPLLAAATNAPIKLDFQTVVLNKPLVIDGINFFGFRFKVPQRTAHEDFVWAFGSPGARHFWFILPETGSMAGFEDFFRERRAAYEDLGPLFPTQGRDLVIQRLSADLLEDGKSYLIWFAFGAQKPGRISVAFTFVDLRSRDAHKRGVLEKALGLHRK